VRFLGDQFLFDGVGWLFGGHEALEQVVEFGLIFIWEDSEAAAESMLRPVLRDGFTALGAGRAGALFRVEAFLNRAQRLRSACARLGFELAF
jgi:hypothetical protein